MEPTGRDATRAVIWATVAHAVPAAALIYGGTVSYIGLVLVFYGLPLLMISFLLTLIMVAYTHRRPAPPKRGFAPTINLQDTDSD